MHWLLEKVGAADKVVDVLREAGGRVVGRTRLQKMFYLLDASGYLGDFSFEYRHYGPYSEELTRAISVGTLQGTVREQELPASWGGTYSIFTVEGSYVASTDPTRKELLGIANEANPIDLELAATAIFLARSGEKNPWSETQRRKPEKATRLLEAKELLAKLSRLDVPNRLPAL
ncbi:MAG: hypothetical protein ACRYFU_17680 [Janthinobacterium lividum]